MTVDASSYMGVATLVTAALFYFPPTIVAWVRRHPNRLSIFLLNLLLGWTLIGWVVALIWSASAIRKAGADRPQDQSGPSADAYKRLAQLADLKDRGHLTPAEFEAEKRKVLDG